MFFRGGFFREINIFQSEAQNSYIIWKMEKMYVRQVLLYFIVHEMMCSLTCSLSEISYESQYVAVFIAVSGGIVFYVQVA